MHEAKTQALQQGGESIMRDVDISVFKSRTSRKCTNRKISFTQLCEEFRDPIRTHETVAEFHSMEKDAKNAIKDVGGIIPVFLKNGIRKTKNIKHCSMLKLDCDKPKLKFFENVKRLGLKTLVHSSHSHTPESPRYRVYILTNRNMTTEEYGAVTRFTACELDIEQFDQCSYSPLQMMYKPSVAFDGEYIHKVFEGEMLDVDALLEKHPDWKDVSTLPMSEREGEEIQRGMKKQADPLAKDGIIGAFNRTYSIEDAIETFLSDIYEESTMEGRYSYIPADSVAGLVIYDCGKFAFSHHASDPVYGTLRNSFDLVRGHLFGDLGEEESVKKMCAFASDDEKVKVQVDEERKVNMFDDFVDVPNWTAKLQHKPRSKILENNTHNLLLILNNDPDFANFGYNEMANRVQVTGDVPWKRPVGNKFWRDKDTAQLVTRLDMRYVSFPNRVIDYCFSRLVDERRFHPIRDFLDSLPTWDLVPRVERLLVDYLGASDTPYTRAVTRKTMAATVARIYKPGIKFDYTLVMDGPQGLGKSTLFHIRAGDE
jgi:hypothetical protein